MWRFCWCYAIPRWLTGKRKYLVIRWSRYIRFVPHVMLTDDLKDVEIEESISVGEKQKGWRGVVHALTSKWTIRKGRDK